MLNTSLKKRALSCSLVNPGLLARESGFSFIELLISILVFSVGILGLASLQITSLRMAQDAQQTYTASLLAGAIANQISANLSTADIEFWRQQIIEDLPSGLLQIQSTSNSHRIVVTWKSSEDQSNVVGSRKSEYILDVSL